MALTEEQEAKLLQLLSAYENGKRVGDLPEVTPGKDSAGLMVEVVDTDGESKKFDLGNVAPVSDKKQLWALVRPGSLTTPGAHFWIDLPGMDIQFDEDDDEKIWAVAPDGYKFGDELVLCNQTIDGSPDFGTAVTETILSSTLDGKIGGGVIVTSSPDNGVTTYIFDNFSGRRSVSEPPALNITMFESPFRLGRTDRGGYPVWTSKDNPYARIVGPDEYDGECEPVLDEDGNPVLYMDGTPIFFSISDQVNMIQETRSIQAFVPWNEFDVTRLQVGRCVAIMTYKKSAVANTNWFITEIDEKGFTVRNANGETSQFFYEGEFWVGKGTDGIAEGSHIMTLAIGDGHFYRFGDDERIEGWNYPYGNDIYDGGRYGFQIGSWLLGNNSDRTFVGTFSRGANEAEGWFMGVEDFEGLSIEMPMLKGDDGFWVMGNSGDVGGMLERTRPDTFYSHMIPLQSNYITSLLTEPWSGDLGQAVRGLLNPELEEPLYAVLTNMADRVPLTMFSIHIMDSDGASHGDLFRLKPIQGGAIDPYSSGFNDHLAIEFYLIAPNGQMFFVRLVYSSDCNIIEEESIIPDGVTI